MNHKKAVPANGTRFSARATLFELFLSQAPVSSGSARTESRNSRRPVTRRTEKMMPDSGGTRRIQTRMDGGCLLVHLKLANCQWHWAPRSCLLINVRWWESPRSNSFVEK